MTAYIIAHLEIHDRDGLEAYSTAAAPVLAKYGAKVLAVSHRVEPLEGEWRPQRIVLIEFECIERAMGWYGSEENREVTRLRQQATSGSIILVPGLQR